MLWAVNETVVLIRLVSIMISMMVIKEGREKSSTADVRQATEVSVNLHNKITKGRLLFTKARPW